MPGHKFCLEGMPTPIGAMLILTDEQDRLRALDWEDYAPRMHRLLRLHYGADSAILLEGGSPSRAYRSLEDYFAGDLSAIDGIPVETGGTEFQREVWAALRRIPVGQTLSYGVLAVRLDRPKAVRAVGLANGANPIGIVVPCHRVIGADASLTGYGGGIERKRWLLEHEGVRLPVRRRAASAAGYRLGPTNIGPSRIIQ
jgi:methylated-DNA-[protein]-cysteine S-methyltransferase